MCIRVQIRGRAFKLFYNVVTAIWILGSLGKKFSANSPGQTKQSDISEINLKDDFFNISGANITFNPLNDVLRTNISNFVYLDVRVYTYNESN